MRLIRFSIVWCAIVLIAGTAWAQQRSGVPARLAIASSEEAPVVTAGHRHVGSCDVCDGVTSYQEVCPDYDCLDRCCGRCPRVFPAIAGGIHAVADHLADTLAAVFPCYHQRWASCHRDMNCCCPQTCCRKLWTPSYRNCNTPCGGLQAPSSAMPADSGPVPTPDQGAHRNWDPTSRTAAVSKARAAANQVRIDEPARTRPASATATRAARNPEPRDAEPRPAPSATGKKKTAVRPVSYETIDAP